MVTSDSVANAAYTGPAVEAVSGPSPEQEGPTKPSKTTAFKNIADDDAAVATIQHSSRRKVSKIQQALNEAGAASSRVQSLSQVLSGLNKKCEQIKELAEQTGTASKGQMGFLRGEVDAILELINKTVYDAQNDNKIFTSDGQDMAISIGDDVEIIIPAKDLSIDRLDRNSDDSEDSMLDVIKKVIAAINEYSGFLIGVENEIESVTTLMQFKLQDILNVERNITERNMSLELGVFSLTRTQEKLRKALRCQEEIDTDKAVELLMDTGKDA